MHFEFRPVFFETFRLRHKKTKKYIKVYIQKELRAYGGRKDKTVDLNSAPKARTSLKIFMIGFSNIGGNCSKYLFVWISFIVLGQQKLFEETKLVGLDR